MTGRPISNRQKVRIMVALTLLAWATQTLLRQWAHGQEAPASPPPAASDTPAPELTAPSAERFLPGTPGVAAGSTLELKTEAVVTTGDIALRQICRWANADASVLAPLGDLVIARFQGAAPFESISLDEVRHTLRDAGVNLAVIRFAGATSCTVSRTDVKYDERDALQQWIDARSGKAPAAEPLETHDKQAVTSALKIAPAPQPPAAAASDARARMLRDLLIEDASVRLHIPADELQINFNPNDDKMLNLSEPQFKFNVSARRVYGLGDVAWDVLIVTDAGNKKISIDATARAWQKQVVLTRPVGFRGVIQNDDVIEKRVLLDHMPDAPLLSLPQCVGQEAARELKPGTILLAPMVNPVALAKQGQFITVMLVSGNIRIKTVARAREAGSYGQTIKAVNEATGAIYEVVLTGPQEGTISPPDLDKKQTARAGE